MKPRSGQVARVHTLPTCDFCLYEGVERPARYDFRVRGGSWANGCIEHYEQHRAVRELGVGAGQFLVTVREMVRVDENGELVWDGPPPP